MFSFLRYQPTPALGRRPMPPPPEWMNGPSMAQSCGKFICRHELSSKSGCTYATPSPRFPSGLTNFRDASFMKSLPVGKIHRLIVAGGGGAGPFVGALETFSSAVSFPRCPFARGRTSYNKLAVFPGGSPLMNRQSLSIKILSRVGAWVGSAPDNEVPAKITAAMARLRLFFNLGLSFPAKLKTKELWFINIGRH